MATAAQITDELQIPLDTPQDGNAPKQQQQPSPLGPNNENLEQVRPELVKALKDLVLKYRQEGIFARRLEIKRIKQARLFWQGLQYCYWNGEANDWKLPYNGADFGDDSDEQEGPRYQFVTNFYQGFGLSFIAAISEKPPTVEFFPESTSVQEDVTAAKVASDVGDLVQRNNVPKKLLSKIGFHCWNDGKLGGYVRFVADGERFGWKDYPTYGMQDAELQPAMHGCANCGQVTPATPESATQGMNCPQCLQPMGADTYQPSVTVPVPQQIGTQRTAKGQEVISIVGGLELNTPIWANEQHEFPYLQWGIEVHKARLKSAYPHIAKKLDTAAPQGAEELYARLARITVTQNSPVQMPGDALQNIVTFDRTWLRPWAFADVEDQKVRAELAQMFPNGCYVAFAGEAYCESRNESMDDKWRVMHAIPGDGQSRPSVGDSLVQVQERYNILTDIEGEQLEYGIPPIYADPAVLDFDAMADTVAEPAAHFPARARAGMSLADGFFQPAAAQVPPELQALKTELMGPTSQFLSGMLPAVFGGEMNDVKTASGYAMARDQAMGRLGLIWGNIKDFYLELIFLGVKCFRDNRPEDVEVPYMGEQNEFKSQWIRLADLSGNIMVQPEEDETFPALKSQQRGALQQLFGVQDPFVQKALTEPANLGYIKNVLGLSQLVIPGEDSRIKQLREIEQLLATGPTMVPPPPGAMGPNGQPAQPQAQPTIPIDPLLDDSAVEFEEGKRWANSDEGQTAKKQNPLGFANVSAHLAAHQQVLQQANQPQQKPPAEQIAFKDLPPDGKMQMAAQAQIKLNPAELAAREQQDRDDKKDELHAKLNAKPAAKGEGDKS